MPVNDGSGSFAISNAINRINCYIYGIYGWNDSNIYFIFGWLIYSPRLFAGLLYVWKSWYISNRDE